MTRFLSACAITALLYTPAFAHHGTNGQFDSTKIIEIGGTITKMAFVNPHSYVYFDVTMPDGEVENWNCELRASSVLRRSGWTEDMFAEGTHIDIVGVASRRDPQGCYVETISFNGSAPIKRYGKINPEMLKPIDAPRPLVTEWGTPNLAGDWAATQRDHGSITASDAKKIDPADLEAIVAQSDPTETHASRWRNGETVAYTDAGKAFVAKVASESVERVTGRLDCTPRDFFFDWTYDQPTNRVEQTKDEIILRYGFMDTVRTIHIQDNFPEEITPSWAGYSIGAWDGDTLVVQTKGFEASGSNRGGYHSEAYETTERFSLGKDGKSLSRSFEARDPLFWQKGESQSGRDTIYPSEVDYQPYNCDDRSFE